MAEIGSLETHPGGSEPLNFSALAEALPLGLALADAQGLYLYANRAYLRLTGRPAAGLPAEHWQEVLPLSPADAGGLEERLRGGERRIDFLLRPEDGSPVEASALALRREGCYQGCLLVLCEAGRPEAARGRAAGRPAGCWESAPETIFCLTPEGRFSYANRAAERLLGRGRDELARMRLPDLVGPEDRELAERLSAQLTSGHPLSGRQLRVRGEGGQSLILEISALPMVAEGQLLAGTVAIARDVTEPREAEAATREACEELRSLERLKEDFMAVLSHELKTPLTPLRVYLEVLLAGKAGPLTRQQREFLQICLKRLEDELILIGNLLDFSRLGREGGQLRREALDLGEVVGRAVDLTAYEARRRGVAVEIKLPEGITFLGDREKLSQVFINLLSNAIRFNRPGGQVTVESSQAEGVLKVSVTDSGIGIPKEELERIFEQFYQVEKGLTRKSEGTGIGLSVARSLARLHGGDIMVESRVGEGSTFTVVLPGSRKDKK